MPFAERIVLWLRALFLRARVETDMDKEMRLHLEMETEQNLRRGMSPAEARRVALVAFGGVEKAKEAVRDERRTRWLEQIAADLRFAFRGFRKHPAFAIGVMVLIALGVGVNSAIFSLVDKILIDPLPYSDGNRMVQFMATGGGGTIMITPTQEDVDRWRARTRATEQIVVFQWDDLQLGDSTLGPTEPVSGAHTVPGALAFVHARPLIGRDLAPADTLSTAERVVLISYGLWQSKFGGSRAAIGQRIVMSGERYRVIGVVPKGFKLPFIDGDQVFMNLRSSGANRAAYAIAKLRPGFTADQANRELQMIFTNPDKSIGQDPPQVKRAVDYVPRTTRRILLLMFGAVFIVLAIACANVANLLLARAWARQREFAIRAAMGAGRARLVRQMFTESVTLSLGGGLLGLGVAALTLKLIVAAQPPNVDYFTNAKLDPVVIVWGFGIAIVTSLLFGLAPAMFVAGNRAEESLKAGARSATGSHSARRFRSGLVIAEVALSAVLLVASGLMLRTIVAMQNADVGLDPVGLWGVRVTLTDPRLDAVARKGAVQAMLDRVRAIPGVRGATIAMALPPSFAIGMGDVEIEGKTVSARDSLKAITISTSRPDFFRIAGIRLLRGRLFTDDVSVTDRTALGEIIVNESFAKRFWPDGGAIGARVRRGNGPWGTIVGVVADIEVPGGNRGTIDRTQWYTAMPASPSRATLVVRTPAQMSAMLPSVTAAIREASPLINIGRAESSEILLARSRSMHRLTLLLIGAFASLALVLAAFGLHAVIAYSVSQRTREIGVRVALGAQAHDVIGLVLGQGLRLSLAGIVVGAVSGVLAAGAMRAMLYGVAPQDPVTLVAVSVLLGAVAIVASYAPARRAMKVDPVDALRSD